MINFENNFLTSPKEKIELSENEKKELLNKGISQDDFFKLLSNNYNQGRNAFIFSLDEKNIIAKKNFNNSSMEPEYAILKLLNNKKFEHSPTPIYFTKEPSILLEEEINGSQIDFDIDLNIEKLAIVLSELHSISFEKFGKPMEKRERGNKFDNLKFNLSLLEDHWKQIILNRNNIANHEANIVSNYLKNINNSVNELESIFSDKKFSLVHFDLHKDNILVDKNNDIILIDWGNSSIGDNAMDIAKLFYKNDFSEKQKQIFFKNYNFSDETIKKRIGVYYPLVILNSLAWRFDILATKEKVDNNFLRSIDKDWRLFDNFNKL
jgi:thiamine kinase-like enzyme